MPGSILYRAAAAVLLVLALAAAARAGDDDVFIRIPVTELTITQGEIPDPYDADAARMSMYRFRHLSPYAALDGEGEAYLYIDWTVDRPWRGGADAILPTDHELVLRTRAGEGGQIRGRLVIPNQDFSGMTAVAFTVPPGHESPEAEAAFHRARFDHYSGLQARHSAGRAWFRHCAEESRRELMRLQADGRAGAGDFRQGTGRSPQDAYALMTGGRAIGENLALERLPQVARNGADEAPTIPVDSIQGITVAEMDFRALLGDAEPALDPLAAAIPADQHAVFFPSFASLASAVDELDGGWLSLTELRAPRAQRLHLLERYERQLCVSTRGLAAVLGPRVVAGIALTGSDPYFPTGADVAVLFETPDAAALRTLLLAQIAAASEASGARPVQGERRGVPYRGALAADRTVSTFVAVLGDAVVVTNSLAQLDRLAAVRAGEAAPMSGLDEYRFFRHRYPRGDEGETALLFVSDAAIRRWCGPRWRIGASRRAVAAGVLAEATAANMDRLVAGFDPGQGEIPYQGEGAAFAGPVTVGPEGARSEVYNTLDFLTPIAELDLDEVTQAEAQAYKQWRDGYQRNWRWAFDPIAVRVGVTRGGLTGDVSVMPLIAGSRYATWIELTRGASFGPRDGDPHDTLWHVAIALDRSSTGMQMGAGYLAVVAPALAMDPLGWMGQCVSLYADKDPIWARLAEAGPGGAEEVLEAEGFALPIALRIESASSLKLAGFVAAVRAFLDQSAPGMLAWLPQSHAGVSYVKVGVLETARTGEPFDFVSVYYAATPSALIVTLSEPLMKRALERDAAARKPGAQDEPPAAEPWLGSNLAVRVDADAWALLPGADLGRDAVVDASWGNLPILNEWKRRYPDRDPVQVHAAHWGVHLVCPAGGRYTWNQELLTMESTAVGSPASPRPDAILPAPADELRDAGFGLTFEHGGLRARVTLEREPRAGGKNEAP